MADVDDIYAAFNSALQAVVYPAGAPVPGEASPLTGNVVRIYGGWPAGEQLDADMLDGICTVSVFAPTNFVNTTRYPRVWQPSTNVATTLTATVSGSTITLTGTAPTSVPQNVAAIVNGNAYVYPIKTSDSLSAIVQGLATLIAQGFPVSVFSNALTITGAFSIVARVGGFATSVMEVQRATRPFHLNFFCPTPALRTALSKPCYQTLAAQIFLPLDDGTGARIILMGDMLIDSQQKPLVYRRTIVFQVEYAITQVQSVPEAIVVEGLMNGVQVVPWQVTPPGTAPTVPYQRVTATAQRRITATGQQRIYVI
jgi:hypothetical protein